jgi:hypothetical protein
MLTSALQGGTEDECKETCTETINGVVYRPRANVDSKQQGKKGAEGPSSAPFQKEDIGQFRAALLQNLGRAIEGLVPGRGLVAPLMRRPTQLFPVMYP